jgi:AcrR family transcriptional regulator
MNTKPTKRRKDEILEVATQLFSMRGFHGTRMDDVAEAAGLNKATVYHYYQSKAEILFDLCINALDDVLGKLRDGGHKLPVAEALKHYVVSVLSLIAETPERSLVYFQESPFLEEWLSENQVNQVRDLENEFELHLRRIMERGVEDHTFGPFDPRLAALAVSGMTNWFCRWYHPDGTQSPAEIADEFTRMLSDGLFASSGAQQPRSRAGAASSRKRAIAI